MFRSKSKKGTEQQPNQSSGASQQPAPPTTAAPATPKTAKAAAWSSTASAVGAASPTDLHVPTNQKGHVAVEMAREGMWLTLEERSLIVKQNVVFYAPQIESSTENDSVTSYQAQMAMSLTSPKNAIISIFCDYCFGRGFQCEPEGAGVRAVKVKYNVARIFVLKVGLNERQERVAIITFSIDEDATPDTTDGDSSDSIDDDDDDDDSNDVDAGAEDVPERDDAKSPRAKKSKEPKKAGGDGKKAAGKSKKKTKKKKAASKKASGAGAGRNDSEQSIGAALFGEKAGTIIGMPQRGSSYAERLADKHSSLSSRHSSSRNGNTAESLARVQAMFGGGSGYFETFVTGVAQQYAAHFCFRKQQAVKMASHLPQ